tara:strand:- start:828 stop:1235 length:408 start_codon:yes stop_codon:yes gene_type:complete
MEDLELSNKLNNLSIKNEYKKEYTLKEILNNISVSINFINKDMSYVKREVIMKFISKNVIIFIEYLNSKTFNRLYTNIPKNILLELYILREELRYFLNNYNKYTLLSKIEFIGFFNDKLHKFIIYSYRYNEIIFY